MTTKAQTAERAEAIAKLREYLHPGDTVRTILRHVSASGMSRSISLIITVEGEPVDISYLAARAMGDKLDPRRGGIKIGGCGMDMGFALVYGLSRTLFRDGFTCAGERCRANDHANPPYPERDGAMQHSDPGYALSHAWL